MQLVRDGDDFNIYQYGDDHDDSNSNSLQCILYEMVMLMGIIKDDNHNSVVLMIIMTTVMMVKTNMSSNTTCQRC